MLQKALPSIFFYFLVSRRSFCLNIQCTRDIKVKTWSPLSFPRAWCTESRPDPADLNASLRDLLELDHIAQPRLAQSSPFCLPSSGESHQRETKTAQTQTQWITTGDNHQKSRLCADDGGADHWWPRGQLESPGQDCLMLQCHHHHQAIIRTEPCKNVNCKCDN